MISITQKTTNVSIIFTWHINLNWSFEIDSMIKKRKTGRNGPLVDHGQDRTVKYWNLTKPKRKTRYWSISDYIGPKWACLDVHWPRFGSWTFRKNDRSGLKKFGPEMNGHGQDFRHACLPISDANENTNLEVSLTIELNNKSVMTNLNSNICISHVDQTNYFTWNLKFRDKKTLIYIMRLYHNAVQRLIQVKYT